MSHNHRLSLDRMKEALKVIDPVFLNSPQYEAETLSHLLGCRLVVKVETVNPIRSFKARGSEYFTAGLEGATHLVCATAGNFGQGMAYSARKRGLRLTVFVSENANPRKVQRMKEMGAEIRQQGADLEEAHDAARLFAFRSNATLVEDGRDAAIAEGAGTIAIELLRWPESFDAIVVPLGDGALLAGMSRWVKAHHPQTQMIGVCAQGAPAMERSWRSGSLVMSDRAQTIADGIAVRIPFPEALSDLDGIIDDILLVEEESIVEAMRLSRSQLGLILEPAGAAALAAVVSRKDLFQRKLIGVVLTGANPSDQAGED